MAKNHSVQVTHHVTHAGKRIIQLKDVGKALALTCVPRGHRQSKKRQMLHLRKAKLITTTSDSAATSSSQSNTKKTDSKN